MKKNFLILLIPFCFLISCGDDYVLYSYTAGVGTYSIFGYIYLIDSNGVWLENAGGTKISVEGGPEYAFTDASGIFLLKGLPGGGFTLIVSKPGYAANHLDFYKDNDSVQYFGTTNLYQIRRVTPNLVIRPFDDGQGSATSPNAVSRFSSRIIDSIQPYKMNSVSIRIFFGKSIFIESSNPYTYLYSEDIYSFDSNKSGSVNISRDALLHSGFRSGDKIYAVAYAAATRGSGGYRDSTSGNWINTGYSPFHSEIRNFILP